MSLVFQGKDFNGNGSRPGLYLGGKDDAKDQEKLKRWRITHILNMTPPKEASVQAGVANYFESTRSFTYLRIPVYDASTSCDDILNAAEDIVSFIAKGLLHGGILVHCQRGVSRSVAAVCMYLMRRENMGLTEILQHLKRRRPCIDPIPSFLDMLKTYESRCVAEGHLTVGGEKKAGNKTTDPESQSQQQRSQTPHRKRPIGPTMPAKNDSTRDDAPVSTSHEESSNSPKRVKK